MAVLEWPSATSCSIWRSRALSCSSGLLVARLYVVVDERFCDSRAEIPASRQHCPDRFDEVSGSGCLGDIALRTRLERPVHIVDVGVHRHDDDANGGAVLVYTGRRLDPVQSRHHDIDQSYVGSGPLRELYRVEAVSGGGHYVDIELLTQNAREPLAHHDVIVRKQDSY